MTDLSTIRTSIEFRYPLGHVHFIAPTVGELIAYLQTLPQDMPALAEWEGVVRGLSLPKVRVFEGINSVVFDVDSD